MARWCACLLVRSRSTCRRFLTRTYVCLAILSVMGVMDQMTRIVKDVQSTTTHSMVPMNVQSSALLGPTLMARTFARLATQSAMAVVVHPIRTAPPVLRIRWSCHRERQCVFLLVLSGRFLTLFQKDVCFQSKRSSSTCLSVPLFLSLNVRFLSPLKCSWVTLCCYFPHSEAELAVIIGSSVGGGLIVLCVLVTACCCVCKCRSKVSKGEYSSSVSYIQQV